MNDTELEVLQDIRTNTSTTASRLSTTNTTLSNINTGVSGTNTRLDTTNSRLNTIIENLVELRGQVIDVRNPISDVQVVRLYIGTNPALTSLDVHAKKSQEEFAKLYNGGYRVVANLGSDKDWATLIMGKYPAPNTAKK